MKKYFGALLLLPLVLMVMAQFATAQDTMSAVLSTPYNSRPGSQIIYYFNEGSLGSGTDSYKSWMTITNTSADTAVLVHYQFYNVDKCAEVFDYVDVLTPQDTTVINPSNLVTINGDFRGTIPAGKYLLTATAIDATLGQGIDTRAISFNYLAGTQVITNLATGSAFGGNAVSRMAVNAYGASLDAGSCFTTPKDFTNLSGRYAIGDSTFAAGFPGCNSSMGAAVPGYTLTGLLGSLNGNHVTNTGGIHETYRLLQQFRPATLIVPHFFSPLFVDAYNNGNSVAFGNRLTLVSVSDIYTDTGNTFKLVSATTTYTPWFIDNDEQPFSLPPRTAICVTEYTLSPRAVGGGYAGAGSLAGIGADFIGAGIYLAANDGGYIKMNATPTAGLSSYFGWFSQSVSDTNNGLSAGYGDLLVGLGRKDVTAATTMLGVATTVLPATEATYIGGVLTAFPVPASSVTP